MIDGWQNNVTADVTAGPHNAKHIQGQSAQVVFLSIEPNMPQIESRLDMCLLYSLRSDIIIQCMRK